MTATTVTFSFHTTGLLLQVVSEVGCLDPINSVKTLNGIVSK